MKTKLTTITLLVLSAIAVAQSQPKPNKIGVSLDCNTNADDTIGPRLCTKLRDKLATSPRYYAATSSSENRFGLTVVSLDAAGGHEVSAQGITTTLNLEGTEMYLTTDVYLTGTDKVAAQADRIFSDLDGFATDFLAKLEARVDAGKGK